MLDCVGFTFARICGILEMDRNIRVVMRARNDSVESLHALL